jgi:hypothetical protein
MFESHLERKWLMIKQGLYVMHKHRTSRNVTSSRSRSRWYRSSRI